MDGFLAPQQCPRLPSLSGCLARCRKRQGRPRQMLRTALYGKLSDAGLLGVGLGLGALAAGPQLHVLHLLPAHALQGLAG